GRAGGMHRCPRATGSRTPARLPRLRYALYAGHTAGCPHGLERRRVRGLPSLPADSMTILCPTPLPAKDRILLGHGSGGKLSAELLREVFLPAFSSGVLARLEDQAILQIGAERLAFTTD